MRERGIGQTWQPPALQRSWSGWGKTVRDLKGLPVVLARKGSLELRLATTKKEIRKVQRLRFDVFYRAGNAIPDAYSMALGRDKCPFDKACDHLLVVDSGQVDLGGKPKVVGTYRLLRDDVAAAQDGFYSESEFDVQPLLERHGDKRFLELGRACVHPDFRSKRVIDMLWHGIGRYAAHHGSDVLIGCSSLPGTRPDLLGGPLGFALQHARASADWQVKAVPSRAAWADWLGLADTDSRQGLAALPPLMKAYVRAGACFASELAVDLQFGTTDLFTVLPLETAKTPYLSRFRTPTAGRLINGPDLRPTSWAGS